MITLASYSQNGFPATAKDIFLYFSKWLYFMLDRAVLGKFLTEGTYANTVYPAARHVLTISLLDTVFLHYSPAFL